MKLPGARTSSSARPPGEEYRIIRARVLYLTALGAACALATLLNPSGYHLLELTKRVMTDDPYLLNRIGEMGPPNWHFVQVLEALILLLAAAAIRPLRLKGFFLTALLLVGLHTLLRHTLPPPPDAVPTLKMTWVPNRPGAGGLRRGHRAAASAGLDRPLDDRLLFHAAGDSPCPPPVAGGAGHPADTGLVAGCLGCGLD